MAATPLGMSQREFDEWMRQFNQGFELNQGQLTGTYLGQDTLDKQKLNAQSGLATLDLVSKLQGPRNAFSQQAVLHGLNATGLSRAVDAIAGRYGLPAFQAPRATPQTARLATLMADVQAGGQWAGGVGWAAAPLTGQGGATEQDYLDALPSPHKIVSREWVNLDPESQQFLLGAYGRKGYSEGDVLNAVKRTLPAFTAPSAGRVA